jgi:pyridoxal phosphate enzyme (YggS family)
VDLKTIISNFKAELPQGVTLVAVSKTHPFEAVMDAYSAGQRIFGENRVQELLPKAEALPKDIEWHLIGHLQTNKVKYIVPFVALIHSIDSFKLLKEVNKEATKCNRVVDCLLQVYIASEETKFGLNEEELFELLSNTEIISFKNCRIVGLMGMATFTENRNQIRSEFQHLKELFEKVKVKYPFLNPHFKELSMGMSSDFDIAIEEGSTLIRVGSAIFGDREYQRT